MWTCYNYTVITFKNTIMGQFLSDHTNQAEALASMADSLAAISQCAQYTTVILAGLLVLRIYQAVGNLFKD